jgi:chromosome segregation ATPase
VVILQESIATSKNSETSGITDMQDLMQRQLLELDQLRDSRRDLNNLLEQTRGKLRDANAKRTRYKKLMARREAEYEDLHRRYEKNLKSLTELTAELKSAKRELETAEKRQEHLQQHINKRARS